MSVSPLSNNSLYCYPIINHPPWRRKFGLFGLAGYDKMLVSHEEWPADKYPDFCLGWVYALTPSLAGRLAKAADVAPFHYQDDLYVTGVLRTAAGAGLDILSSFWLLKSWIWKLIYRWKTGIMEYRPFRFFLITCLCAGVAS